MPVTGPRESGKTACLLLKSILIKNFMLKPESAAVFTKNFPGMTKLNGTKVLFAPAYYL